MASKPFKTISEQVELLRERGLIINNEEYAFDILSHVNYYRLSGYTLTLRKNDVFYSDVTLESVMQLYNFDTELRVALLYLLEYIEVSFRTHLGYHHSQTYSPLGYKSKDNFHDEKRHEKFISEIERFIKENEKNEIFITHHNNKYEGDFPFWVIVELTSFGCLSKAFKNLKESDKKTISSNYYEPIPHDYIENWLHGLVILRNICAHRGRLYNRYISFAPRLSPKDKKLFKNNNLDLNKNVKQVFSYIYIMKKLIKNEMVMKNFMDRLNHLISKYPFVKLVNYGFPENWQSLI
jgi:abortive infection bacteriophage resistance protein